MSKYSKYFAIETEMRSKGMPVDRADLISQFTEGSKSSLTELSDSEYQHFCLWLNHLSKSYVKNENWQKTPENRMRRKVIALLIKAGYWTPAPNGKPKADMKAINTWVKKYGYLHKELNDYTLSELPRLVSQAEAVRKKQIER